MSSHRPRGKTRHARNALLFGVALLWALTGLALLLALATDISRSKHIAPLAVGTSAAIPYVGPVSADLDISSSDAIPGAAMPTLPPETPPARTLPEPDDTALLAAAMPEVIPPHCRLRSTAPLPADIGPKLVEFENSPFPYRGNIPNENKPFMDRVSGNRYGHTSPRGSLHWEDENYHDRHSLLYLPKGFNPSQPGLIIVFFHGNHARLIRDVYARQKIPQQLAATGLNAVLVAPQFALDVADSSAGRFWEPGTFRRFLAEAGRHLAQLYGDPCARSGFNGMKVVLVAYSGGYNPTAYALDVGGANLRVHGVVLLDALYGEIDKFERWIGRRGSAFFFSAYSESSQGENIALQRSLSAQHVEINPPKPLRLAEGSVTFISTGAGVRHNDFVTQGWVREPLKVILSGIEGFRMSPKLDEVALPHNGSRGAPYTTARSTSANDKGQAPPVLSQRGSDVPEP